MIRREWEAFAKAIFTGMNVSDVQYRETRKAFYAGAVVVFGVVKAVGEPDVSEDAGEAMLQSIQDDLESFHSELKNELRNRN
jgi:hypothetical protein